MKTLSNILIRIFFGKPIHGEKIDYNRGQKVKTTLPDKPMDFNEWARIICNINNQK